MEQLDEQFEQTEQVGQVEQIGKTGHDRLTDVSVEYATFVVRGAKTCPNDVVQLTFRS